MAIARSKSTLSVSLDTVAHNNPHESLNKRPRTHRAKTSFPILETPLSPLSFPPSSPSPVERAEDPFNLSSFFPSRLKSAENNDEQEWDWLRVHAEADGEEGWTGMSYSGLSLADASKAVPQTPSYTSITEVQEDETIGIIENEDRLGILALGRLVILPRQDKLEEEQLLSPFSEDGFTDDEGLYHALSALRKTYSIPRAYERDDVSVDELFSGRTEESTDDDVLEYDGRGSLVYRSMWRVIHFVDSQL